MHHVYKIDFLSDDQFRFTPQKSTTDAAMAVKQFIEPELESGRVVIMASLDVRGAFDTAWWPAILKGLRDNKCPLTFTNLRKTTLEKEELYYQSTAVKWRRILPKAVHKGHAAGPVFGTYNITPYLA